MKKIISAALALTLLIGTAQAQGGDRHHGRDKKEMRGAMAKELNLTESQKAELKKLRESMHAEMKAVQQNGSLTQDQARTQRQAIHEKYQGQMQAILTPEQKAKAENLKDKRKEEFKDKRKDKVAQVGRELNLTPEQKTKMEGIRQSFAARREAIQNNKDLTKAQKREQLKALAQEHKAQVQAVLTDEQEKKAKSLMKEHRLRTR